MKFVVGAVSAPPLRVNFHGKGSGIRRVSRLRIYRAVGHGPIGPSV